MLRGALRRKILKYKNRHSLESLKEREKRVSQIEEKAKRSKALKELQIRERKAKQMIKSESTFGRVMAGSKKIFDEAQKTNKKQRKYRKKRIKRVPANYF